MKLSILTPVYNRANLLIELYNSLLSQTNNDFEWIIIDDGSTDNIDDIVNTFIKDGVIKILYSSQINQGKHIAVNHGIKLVSGEMVYIVDSDDSLPPDAVEFILKESQKIINDDYYAGISGIDQTKNGKLLCTIPSTSFIDTTILDLRIKYKVFGDLAEIYKTEVLRKFPFPETSGEKYCAESTVWNRIANNGFKLKFFPKVLKIIEYLPDGLSSSLTKHRMNSPINAMTNYSDQLLMNLPLKFKVKASINYWRFYFCPTPHIKPKISLKWYWTFPLGMLIHLYDKIH